MEKFYITLTGSGEESNRITVDFDRPIELEGAWSVSMTNFAYKSSTQYLRFAHNLTDLVDNPEQNYSYIGAQLNHGSIMYDTVDSERVYRVQIGSGKEVHRGRPRYDEPNLAEVSSPDAPLPLKLPDGQYPTRLHVAQSIVDAIASDTDFSDNFEGFLTSYGEFGIKLKSVGRFDHLQGRFDGRQFIIAGPVLEVLGFKPNASIEDEPTPFLVDNIHLGRSLAFVNSNVRDYQVIPDTEFVAQGSSNGGRRIRYNPLHGSNDPDTSQQNPLPGLYDTTVAGRQIAVYAPVTRTTPVNAGYSVSANQNNIVMVGHTQEELIQNVLLFGKLKDVVVSPVTDGSCSYDEYFSGQSDYPGNILTSWTDAFNVWERTVLRVFEKDPIDGGTRHVRVDIKHAGNDETGIQLMTDVGRTQTYTYQEDDSDYIKIIGETPTTICPPQVTLSDSTEYNAYYYKMASVRRLPANVGLYVFNKLESYGGPEEKVFHYPAGYRKPPRIGGGRQMGAASQTSATLSNATDFGFVYSDIVQPSWVGTVLVPFLGLVPINQGEAKSIKLGSTEGKRKHFVSTNRFQRIICAIATSKATYFNFDSGSEVYITLEFTKEGPHKIQSKHGL